MKSVSCVIAIAVALLAVLINPALAQHWLWDTSNRLLNPSGINVTPPASPYLFDADDDSDYDLIIGQGDGTIKLYYNDGFPDSIRWRERPNYFANLDFAYAVVPTLVDIDQDDSLELVLSFKDASNMPVDSLKVFRNRGTPTDPLWSLLPDFIILDYANLGFFADCRFIDWDRDGDNDLICRGWSYENYFCFANDGASGNPHWSLDSTMTAAFSLNVGPCGYEGFDIADFNNDGAFDIMMSSVVCDDGSAVQIFMNEGTNQAPHFQYDPDQYIFPTTGYMNGVTCKDIDDDGDFDMITGGSFSVIEFYRNNGSAAAPLFDGAGDMRLGPFYIDGCRDFTFLDRERDGDLDMAAITSYLVFDPVPYPHFDPFLDLRTLENVGNQDTPDFRPADWIYIWNLPVVDMGLSSGDLTGDHLADICWSCGAYLRALINVENGNFADDDSIFSNLNGSGDYRHPELADLDSDGDQDLIAIDDFTDQLTAFENTGPPQAPNWTPRPEWLSGLNPGAFYANVAYLDRGNLPDLVLKHGNGIQGYLNIGTVGNPQFEYAPEIFESIVNYPVQYFDMADLDGDGDQDVIVNNDGSFIFIENQSVVAVESDASTVQVGFEALNYPNPFGPETSISFSLSTEAEVNVRIFDIVGRLVRELSRQTYGAGRHSVRWDSNDNAGEPARSGVYFYRISIDGKAAHTHRMMLLR